MRPIPNHPNYFADEIGNIYSTNPYHHRNDQEPRLLKQTIQDGYRFVSLRRGGKRPVHQLILETFVGPRPRGMLACHGGNGLSDNSLKNLYWATPSRNCKEDRVRDGTNMNGEKNHQAKLSAIQVRIIRKVYGQKGKRGLSQPGLAKIFNVTQATISSIIRGKTWFNMRK